MKKLNILLLMVMGLFIASSCDSDRDSNPIVQVPETFVLNIPPYASNTMDLLNSSTFELTTTQPDYGYTAPVVYSVQVSLDDTWVDATEEKPASYYTLGTTFTSARFDAVAPELARGIVSVAGWTDESEVPTEAITVYVRLKAHQRADLYPVYSNSVELSVIPYFILLKDADPAFYYLVGDCIGDGSWGNPKGLSGIGVSLIPMALVKDTEYDKITGTGEFIYRGYFPADKGFKLVGNLGDWDEQWGNGGAAGIGNLVRNDGGSSNIQVPSNGWYEIRLNSETHTLTITAIDINPIEHATMHLVGDFNNWGNDGVFVEMNKVPQNVHMWYADVTIDTNGGVKFRNDVGWSSSWGGDGFPFALSTANNIPVEAGNYRVILNDLDNCYYFFANE